MDRETHVVSVHDFLPNETLKQGHERFCHNRSPSVLQCFMRKLIGCNNLQLIRTNVAEEPLEKTVELHDVILQSRDGLPFDLYVFQDSEFMRTDWGVKHLHTFYAQPWRWNEEKRNWEGHIHMYSNFFLGLRQKIGDEVVESRNVLL